MEMIRLGSTPTDVTLETIMADGMSLTGNQNMYTKKLKKQKKRNETKKNGKIEKLITQNSFVLSK